MIDPIQAEIDAILQGPAEVPPTDPIQAEIDNIAPPAGQEHPLLAKLGQLLSAPREQQVELIRGQDGVIAGARLGDRLVEFQRGQDGRIAGMRMIDQGPTPQLPSPPI